MGTPSSERMQSASRRSFPAPTALRVSRALLALGLCLALAAGGAVAANGASVRRMPVRAQAAVIGGQPVADILDARGRTVGQCSGSVIAPTLVLTAAHCVENVRTGTMNPPAGFRVLTGTVSWSAPAHQLSSVSSVLVYDAYDRRADAGDAALLVLATPTSAPTITLAAVPQAAYFRAGAPALLAGWGVTSFAQGAPTEALRSAPTVVQAPKWCHRYAPPFYARTEICAVDPPAYATGGCSGDSGGPLLARDPEGGELVQIGIAVHVYGRCSTRRPTVYTRSDAIAAWAQSWIRAYSPPPAPAPEAPPAPAPVAPPAG
jgi:trypsin